MAVNLAGINLSHPVVDGVIVFYLFSAAISAMPEPGTKKPLRELIYQWFFGFTHTLLNNAEAAMKAKYPDLFNVKTGSLPKGSGTENPTQ